MTWLLAGQPEREELRWGSPLPDELCCGRGLLPLPSPGLLRGKLKGFFKEKKDLFLPLCSPFLLPACV